MTMMRRFRAVVFLGILVTFVQAGPAWAQSFVDVEELGLVRLVYLEVHNEIGDDCFASTRTFASDVQKIMRDHDIIATDIRRFSTNILSLRVIGSLAEGTDVCTAALDIEMYRWVGIRSGNVVRVASYRALALVSADRAEIFARLRENVAAFVSHLATEIQNARAHAG